MRVILNKPERDTLREIQSMPAELRRAASEAWILSATTDQAKHRRRLWSKTILGSEQKKS